MKNIELKTIWKDGINKDASKIQIQGTSVRLNESASFYYTLYTDTDEEIAEGSMILEGDEYNNWGNQDDYVYEVICSKLGLTLV